MPKRWEPESDKPNKCGAALTGCLSEGNGRRNSGDREPFRVVGCRHRLRITTHKNIYDRTELLAGAEGLAMSILDQRCHHPHLLDLRGRSYRLRDIEEALMARTPRPCLQYPWTQHLPRRIGRRTAGLSDQSTIFPQGFALKSVKAHGSPRDDDHAGSQYGSTSILQANLRYRMVLFHVV